MNIGGLLTILTLPSARFFSGVDEDCAVAGPQTKTGNAPPALTARKARKGSYGTVPTARQVETT
jgi:hypothetical protein